MSVTEQIQAARSPESRQENGFELQLLAIVAVLLAFGALMVASATVGDTGGARFGPTLRHLLHVAIGVAAMLLASRVPVGWWEAMSKPLLLLSLALLVVLVTTVLLVMNRRRGRIESEEKDKETPVADAWSEAGQRIKP